MEAATGTLLGMLVGAGVTLGVTLINQRWEKEKWLLDHEAKECTECIDLLWTSRPPGSKADLESPGWDTDDFNGRMDSLRRVPAKLASLMLYQAHRREITVDFETARKTLKEEIDKVREENDKPVGEKKFKNPHKLPQAIDGALNAVEQYLKIVKEQNKDNWVSRIQRSLCNGRHV
jgi:hypothetical protein